jgi:glycosyltransferase involved in cell wall biosynthesis
MKDHANFLRAASRLAQQHNNIMFVLAGRGVNSNNSVIGRLREQLGMREKTVLLDERRDIAQLMASLDIASSASSWGEGFPNVVGEAMASGVPCVVTDVGDSASIVGNEGLVVPPGDPSALAHAWRTLIDIGRDGRRRLGIRARIRISREFSLDRIVRRYEQLYEDVMSKNNRFNAS